VASPHPRKRFQPKILALAVASCFSLQVAHANPTLPTVTNGQAAFSQQGKLLSITNSPNAIINWQGFSIAHDETTRFIQQSASSAVLNRVVGTDPSSILGALQSNGRVFLINPNGIIFGAGAQIDVAGLIASTLRLTDTDFVAGRLRFLDTPGAAGIINQGIISTASGGQVVLVAPEVNNSGLIASPRGEVVLAAGKSAELFDPAAPNLRVQVDAPEGSAVNLGRIVADSGKVSVYANAIQQSGLISADTVAVGKNGEILLKASKDIVLAAGSQTTASGAPGGVHDGGSIRIVADDTLDMQRDSAVRVDGGIDGGNGGFLELSGKQQIALNGEYTGRARKEGYRNGTLLIDPLNVNIGAFGLTTTIALASAPGAVVIKQDGTRVYVVRPNFAGRGSDTLQVIDTATDTLIASVSLGDASNAAVSGMALSPDGSKLYAVFGNTGSNPGYIKVVDTATNTVSTTYNVAGPTNLRGLAVDAAGLIYVVGNVPNSNPAASRMAVLNAAGTQIATVPVAFNPSRVVVNPVSMRAYVTSGQQLQEFETVGFTPVGAPVILTSTPNTQAISPDGLKLYNLFPGRIEVRDLASANLPVIGADGIGYGGDDFALNALGSAAYLTSGGSVAVLDFATKNFTSSFKLPGTDVSGLVYDAAGNRVYTANTGTGGNSVSVVGLNVGTDTTTNGVVAHTDSPGGTLTIAPASLSGAWTDVSLAATNNVNVNSALVNGDIPAGGMLSLFAGNDVNVNAPIGSATARFDHDLAMTAGNDVNVYAPIYLGSVLTMTADAAIPAQAIVADGVGNVNIQALAMPVVIDTLGPAALSGQNVNIHGGNGRTTSLSFTGALTVNAAGNFLMQGGNNLWAPRGDVVDGSVSVNASSITVAAGGTVTVAAGDDARATNFTAGTGTATATSNASLTATNAISLTGTAITLRGGDITSASAGSGQNTATANANSTVTAGTTLTLTGTSLTVRGGNDTAATASSSGTNTATASANVTVNAGQSTTMNVAGPILIAGGDGASVEASFGKNSATVNANAMISAPAITVNATGPNASLTVRGGNNAQASASYSGTNTTTVNANAKLAAGQAMNLNVAGPILIAGGDFGTADAYGDSSSEGGRSNNTAAASVNATVSAGTDLTVTNATDLTVRGGNSGSASADYIGTNTATLNANATLSAGQTVSLAVAGPILVAGGDSHEVSASSGKNNATANANATVSAGTNLTVASATGLTVRGGNSGSAYASESGTNVATWKANAKLEAGQAMNLSVVGPVLIAGGDFMEASATYGKNIATTNANATVSAGTNLTVTNATDLTVRGGNSGSADADSIGTNTATANANAKLEAGQAMNLSVAGPVLIAGGDFVEASASSAKNSATVNVNATVSAGTVLTVADATSLTVRGGNSGSAEATDTGANVAAANANATVTGATINVNVAGPVLIQGGNNDEATAGCCASSNADNRATFNANAAVTATSGLTMNVTNGSLTVAGGDSARADASEVSGTVVATTNVDATLSAGSTLAVNVTNGAILVRGGNNARASASASSAAADGQAQVFARGKITAPTVNLTATGAGGVTVQGGDNARASASNIGGQMTVAVNVDGIVDATGLATLNITSNNLTVRGGDLAHASASDSGVTTATLSARGVAQSAGAANFNVSGPMILRGGGDARAEVDTGTSGTRTASADVSALVTSGGTMIANASSLDVLGGVQGEIFPGNFYETRAVLASGTNAASTTANASLISGTDFTYTGGSARLLGGTARTVTAVGNNAATAEANALVQAAGVKQMTITGDLDIIGGTGVDSGLPNLGQGVIVRAILDPTLTEISTTGNVNIAGGSVTGLGSAEASLLSAGPVNLTIGGSTGLTITGAGASSSSIIGGSGAVNTTFTGGGTANFVNNSALATAGISGVAPPPPPPPPPPPVVEVPPPTPDPDTAQSVLDSSLYAAVDQSLDPFDAFGSRDTEPGDSAGAPDSDNPESGPFRQRNKLQCE